MTTPDRQTLEAFYRGETAYAERMGTKFSNHWRAVFADYARKVQHFCPHSERVLDLGCGNGVSTALLKDSVTARLAVGVDLSLHSLAAGRKQAPHMGATLLNASVHALPFKDAIFDLVTSHAMVEHLLEADGALQEMHRVLKAGGLLVIAAPNMLSPFRAAKLFVRGLRRWSFHPDGTPRIIGKILWQILCRLCLRAPKFAYRQPVLETNKFLGSDYDAVFLVNPFDLRAWARQRHYRVLNVADASSRLGRIVARLSPPLAGGVLFVARKPSA